MKPTSLEAFEGYGIHQHPRSEPVWEVCLNTSIVPNVYCYENKDGSKKLVIRKTMKVHGKSKSFTKTVDVPSECNSKRKLEVFASEQRNDFFKALENSESPELTRMTFSEYFEGPCQSYKSTREKTWNDYNNHYRRHMKDYLGEIKVNEINKRVVVDYFKYLDEKGVGPSTYNALHRLLKKILNYAVEDGILAKNPLSSKAVGQKKVIQDTSALTDSEAEDLIQFLENEPLFWRTMYMLMITTGMRRGEIVALTWDCVHLDGSEPYVEVRSSVEYVPGKGLISYPPKTPESRRNIPLLGVVCKLLDNMSEENNEGYVFHSPNGTGIMMFPDTVTRHTKRVCEKFGKANFTPHTLRRTFATSLAVSNKVDLKTLQQLMGHANLSTLVRYYVLPADSIQRSAVKVLENNLGIESAEIM